MEQAGRPLLNPLEMNNPDPEHVVQTVRGADYADRFTAVYGRDALKNVSAAFRFITDALVAYERSAEISPFSSRFDLYITHRASYGPQAAMGRAIFEGKGGCTTCHPSSVGPGGTPPLFTNHGYANMGVPRNPNNPFYHMPPWYNEAGMDYVDVGLGGVEGLASQAGKIKVPTLRNVADTAPYGHNGYLATLREAVAFAANRGPVQAGWKDPGRPRMDTSTERTWPRPEVLANLDTRVGVAQLTDDEIDAVVAFLETLTDGEPLHGMRDPGRPRQEESVAGTPAAIRISPNPFNPATRIEFTVQDGATVRLAVYDVTGRLVRSLVDSAVPAGVHAATWDGTDARGARVASGIYFVRLDTNERTVIRKAVLTR
jgi:cytochrome c peroxidase